MSLVVDASVVVAVLIDDGEDGYWAAEALLTDDLAAPEFMLIETTNVLRRFVANGLIPDSLANSAQRDLFRLDVQLYPFSPLADRVWSLRSNLTSYDAVYVALAESLDAPLATLDRRLATQTANCEFLLPDT